MKAGDVQNRQDQGSSQDRQCSGPSELMQKSRSDGIQDSQDQGKSQDRWRSRSSESKRGSKSGGVHYGQDQSRSSVHVINRTQVKRLTEAGSIA